MALIVDQSSYATATTLTTIHQIKFLLHNLKQYDIDQTLLVMIYFYCVLLKNGRTPCRFDVHNGSDIVTCMW